MLLILRDDSKMSLYWEFLSKHLITCITISYNPLWGKCVSKRKSRISALWIKAKRDVDLLDNWGEKNKVKKNAKYFADWFSLDWGNQWPTANDFH